MVRLAAGRTKRSLKAQADKLFSQLVRKSGICEWCGRSHGIQLQACHIFSRRFLSTRFSLLNAMCLCAACHRKGHDQPVEFVEFARKQLGEIAYDELRLQAKTKIGKPDYPEIIKDLKNRLEH